MLTELRLMDVAEDSLFLTVSFIDSLSVIASASETLVAPGTSVVLFGQPSGLPIYTDPTDPFATLQCNKQMHIWNNQLFLH